MKVMEGELIVVRALNSRVTSGAVPGKVRGSEGTRVAELMKK